MSNNRATERTKAIYLWLLDRMDSDELRKLVRSMADDHPHASLALMVMAYHSLQGERGLRETVDALIAEAPAWVRHELREAFDYEPRTYHGSVVQ